MINGVHHISIATTDMAPMLEFYRDLLGLEIREAWRVEETDETFQTIVGLKNAAFHAAWLRAGNVEIEIFHYLHPPGRPLPPSPACDAGIRHICFDVSDLESEHARLTKAGVKFFSAPQLVAAAGVTTVYARDPDGNIVELQEVHAGSAIPNIATYAPLNG
jgi:catechol 2,3-dioxygenase-like lactoylglutathione lyase family enzyme